MINVYLAHKTGFWFISLTMTIVLCAAHYSIFVKRQVKPGSSAKELITRFNFKEVIFHWLRIIMFFILFFTGIEMLYKSEAHLGPHHGFIGVAFLIIAIINLALWRRDVAFRSYDWIWIKSCGGYLSTRSMHLPAGRFNAGQKIYYWLMLIAAIALFITATAMEQGAHHTLAGRQNIAWGLHGLIGCFSTIMVIGHIYLSILANPETARVVIDGKISRDYIDEHHSQWLNL
ncbi:cytochrome b/b6 domain-containing protein [Syntrophomonas palmitatica]|uniref:cytochrome b/b6 domain-containing protein n=1 Tax=Syntrophomonas palmitatica TaxID=402877 RepID=UPI0006D17567|nr:cytochrome b/b6 domain-containing protein [Syntrophomonas palmitatica]